MHLGPLPLPAVPLCIPHSEGVEGGTAGYALESCLSSCGLVHFQGSPSGDGALETHFPGDLGWSGTHGWDAGCGKGTMSFFTAAGHF